MEKKKTVFDYLAQVFTIFGFAMMVMNVFCLVFGDSAKEFSAMYELGSQGIPVNIAFQFFCVSILIVSVRFVFLRIVL